LPSIEAFNDKDVFPPDTKDVLPAVIDESEIFAGDKPKATGVLVTSLPSTLATAVMVAAPTDVAADGVIPTLATPSAVVPVTAVVVTRFASVELKVNVTNVGVVTGAPALSITVATA
jgi:hypothetical protein